jgi:hypothetical protein
VPPSSSGPAPASGDSPLPPGRDFVTQVPYGLDDT